MRRRALTAERPSSEAAPDWRPQPASGVLAASLGLTFDAVILTDRAGVILETNDVAAEMFGYRPDEAAGLPIAKLLVPRSHPDTRPDRGGMNGTGRFPYEGRNMALTARHASGRVFAVTANISRLAGNAPQRFIGFFRDASRFVEAEERLVESEERRDRAERELEELGRELRALALKLPRDVENERRRIARGLHDQVGNALAMVKVRLGELRQSVIGPQATAAWEDANRQTAAAMQEIRSLTFELSSPVLYELGLEAALKSLGRRLAERHDIGFEFSSDGQPKPLSEERQVILYRIIEELLVNIVKHAWANHARIAVGRAGGDIRITVEDDGVGPGPAEGKIPGPDGGFGLFGVKQRLAPIDGTFTIEAAFPSGTRALVTAPLELEAE